MTGASPRSSARGPVGRRLLGARLIDPRRPRIDRSQCDGDGPGRRKRGDVELTVYGAASLKGVARGGRDSLRGRRARERR